MLRLRGPKLAWRTSRWRPIKLAVKTKVGAIPLVRAVKRDDRTGNRFVASDRTLTTHGDSARLYALGGQGRWSGDNHERSRHRRQP
jgi:hypothetical protein